MIQILLPLFSFGAFFLYAATAETGWEVTPGKVQAVVDRLVATTQPVQIILFGSFVTGRIHPDSDLDILVVTKEEVSNPRAERVRLRSAVDDIQMAMDILVVSECTFRQLCKQPGLVYYEAARHGRIAYEQGRIPPQRLIP